MHPFILFQTENWHQNLPLITDTNASGDKHTEDVPHLTHFLPDLQSYTNPLKRSQAYAIVKKTFVSPEDMVAKDIIVQKDSPRGTHFRCAGPREKVFFTPEEVRACIVTCGGLCPGINTVIREIVCGLKNMYGVDDVLGIQVRRLQWVLVKKYPELDNKSRQ
ncbi:hypothetical protein RND71_018736 [Anisodus tanguticus]|uniref:Uncharacterized protein n=1 Tax=Anisodus tanguticus TaxID=243964 RepID=A0AAE1S4S6_9SOLA|nr:hypothetical protein RND71_018736 [Anisodus tanguticus]